MKSIGGYFGLELRRGKEYHEQAIRLNTGRNALEYIFRAGKYRKVHMPLYSCEVMRQPAGRLGLEVEYYPINEAFEPVFEFDRLKPDEVFIYINYFGLHDNIARSLAGRGFNLIIDNAQSFYSMPLEGVDTFYSPRKFFGVPDGGYLYTDKRLDEDMDDDFSFTRFDHLLRRTDVSPESGYQNFLDTENSFSELQLRKMSRLTRSILGSIDYDESASRRKENFKYLNENLGGINRLSFKLQGSAVPMVYPFLADKAGLREELIRKKIYTAQYWPDVLSRAENNSLENFYTQNIVHLPVDQRISKDDCNAIISAVAEYNED